MKDIGSSASPDIAERKRQLVRDELAGAALVLLAEQGFEQTTVDQIVAAVGMSRRTFSRYFQSKEDVMVHLFTAAGEEMCHELRSRPADEATDVALRHAIGLLTAQCRTDPQWTMQVSRLILDSPALHARFLERQSSWQAEMAGILARRAALDESADLRPALAAAVALTAFQTVLRRWVDINATISADDLLDEAFAAIKPVLGAVRPAS